MPTTVLQTSHGSRRELLLGRILSQKVQMRPARTSSSVTDIDSHVSRSVMITTQLQLVGMLVRQLCSSLLLVQGIELRQLASQRQWDMSLCLPVIRKHEYMCHPRQHCSGTRVDSIWGRATLGYSLDNTALGTDQLRVDHQ